MATGHIGRTARRIRTVRTPFPAARWWQRSRAIVFPPLPECQQQRAGLRISLPPLPRHMGSPGRAPTERSSAVGGLLRQTEAWLARRGCRVVILVAAPTPTSGGAELGFAIARRP